MEDRQLAIPIYLNQRVVFDLLAIVEEGFSQLRTVKTSESDTQAKTSNVGGEVGASNVFAFLGIALKGGRTREQASASQRESSEERVFTPTSLFSRLRDVLVDRKRLQILSEGYDIQNLRPGTFVEFEAILHKNPLVHTIEGFIHVLEMSAVFENMGQDRGNQKDRASKPKGKSESQSMIGDMRKFLGVITRSDKTDLVADVTTTDLRAVVPVELQYFSDKSPDDLLDGQYTVLGKVERTIPADGQSAINLLRGTSLGLMSDDSIDELLDHFKELPAGFKFPEVETRIAGPAIQISPIAIFI